VQTYLVKYVARKKRVCHNDVMKMPRKLIWKIYFFIFSTITLANLVWVFSPEAEPYIFYHILIAWTKFYLAHYYLAALKCAIALLCLIPLFGYAFDRTTRIPRFWQWILVIRVLSEFVGNFYEFMFVKSSFHMVLGYGLTTTGLFILPLIPSYAAHYLYAFNKSR
jgi:hypothetical protein